MSWLHDPALIQTLYIVAFSLFIYGLMGLTGPKTAVRGNLIAAVGMAIAVGVTLLTPGMGNWWLILLGVAIGTAVGIPAARRVKMTAVPQMVALFNGRIRRDWIVVGRRAGFRAPVKRSENNNCQHAVCIRCLRN